MCGACGRPLAADPAFPDGRTTRGNLIAAQIINQLCSSLTGRVKVAGLPDGFVVSAPGRGQALCATVSEAWAAVFAAAPASVAVLETTPDGLEARYSGGIEHRMLEAVIAMGREARALRGDRAPTGLAPHRPSQIQKPTQPLPVESASP